MNSIYKIALGLSAVTLIGLVGCKKFRDVNTNPNNPEQVDIKFILPSAEAGIAQYIGGKYQVVGGMWSQYWTQTTNASQYQAFDQYLISGSETNNSWVGMYSAALMDLQKIIDNAGNQTNYAAIAKILKGYTYQALTDMYGDIPFSEALGGESKNITSPHYDSQEAIYAGIIAMVKEGMGEINAGAAPGNDDLIYHGDMASWQVFANTLLLKMYMRLAYRSPSVAQQGIAELYANGIGFIGDNAPTAKVAYSSQAGNYNPLYSEMNNATINKIQNLIASSTAIDSFSANNDPRIAIFYTPGSGGFLGNRQGDYNSGASATSFATPSAAVGADADDEASAVAPVIFISDYESLFLQAEAVARGWADGDAKALYDAAIEANFNAYADKFASLQADGVLPTLVADSVATSDSTGNPVELLYDVDYAAGTYINGDADILTGGTYYLEGEEVSPTPASYWGQFPESGTTEEKIRFIITQKWFSMCGNQNIESWTEWRRTGYPEFFQISVNTRIGPNLPVRVPYPDDELTNNVNFPGQKAVTDKVWWDNN